MQKLIPRKAEDAVYQHLDIFPAVAILGPRQCGKSTLVKMMLENHPDFLYLDLQNRADLAKLNEPELFFSQNRDKIVCLDEIQLFPELFAFLRSEIDTHRKNGRFILLGSASRNLIQKTAETLAGRVGVIELTPFLVTELQNDANFQLSDFWFRGGFPNSFLAPTDEASNIWRENFLRTYVERDIPQFGFQITSNQLMRLITMCSHLQGQLFNISKMGESLGVTHPTVKRYIDILEQTYIIRTLPPYETNLKKRLVKSPKIFVRDSGLLHRILYIQDFNNLLGNPVVGSSWEGMVVENVCSSLKDCEFMFFRSAVGEELDLIIRRNKQIVAVECKASVSPQLTKGFWSAVDFVKPGETYVISPVESDYPIAENVFVVSLPSAIQRISDFLNKKNKCDGNK